MKIRTCPISCSEKNKNIFVYLEILVFLVVKQQKSTQVFA